jgi:chromosome segregation ATPase
LVPRGLQPEDALRAIEYAMTDSQRRSTTSDQRQRQAVVELARLKANPNLVKSLLRILDHWRTRAREAEVEAGARREEVAVLNSKIGTLEQSLSEYREIANNLEARLLDHGRRLEDREREFSAQHNLSQSQLALTRGTINGWLETEVRPRLTDALDAAECDPPRNEVLRERLKALLGLLDQKKGGQWG